MPRAKKKWPTQRQAEAAMTELFIMRAAVVLNSDDDRRYTTIYISPRQRRHWSRILQGFKPSAKKVPW